MEPEDSLPPSQHLAACPYYVPHQPRPRFLIHFNIIVKPNLRSYNKWSRHKPLFLSLSPNFIIPSHCHHPSFHISKNICWEAKNYKAPRHVVFSTPLSAQSSHTHIPPSAPYSRTPSAYSQMIKSSLLRLFVTQPFMWIVTGCWKLTVLFGRPVPNISRDSRHLVYSFIPPPPQKKIVSQGTLT